MNSLFILADAAPSLADSTKATLEQFGWDWHLFLSNFVSFLLVCFLLNRFAYAPIVKMLEARREKIAESLKNAEKIKAELADAEAKKAEILSKANADATKMIEEARAAAAVIKEKETQQAVTEAQQIIAKAHDATRLEHDRMLTELKREVGHLVVSMTSRVTGKVLTDDDQRRINEQTASEIAA
jgi:F-type H+-transporting ATPase subunit b